MALNWFSITARDKGPAEVFIYDQIGVDWFTGDGVNAKAFAEGIKPHAERDLVVRINSPGGAVWDGLAIYNQLKAHKGHVTTRVEGLAASIASIIALAGKTVEMGKGSMIMIHNPSAMVEGGSEDLRDSADQLDRIGENLAGVYAAETGLPSSKFLAAMAETKWFDATEAKAWGLIDNISAPFRAMASFDLSRFKKVPTAYSELASARAEVSQLKRKLIERDLDQCVTECRIPANDKDEWLTRILKDESLLKTVQNLQPPVTASPPVSMFYHDGQHGAQNTLEQQFKQYNEKLKAFRKVR